MTSQGAKPRGIAHHPLPLVNVLFVCSDNTVLSIMAESILKGISPNRFGVFSAGCLPRAALDEYVLQLLKAHHLPVLGVHPKALHTVRFPAAPKMDFIITLSAVAAEEQRKITRLRLVKWLLDDS